MTSTKTTSEYPRTSPPLLDPKYSRSHSSTLSSYTCKNCEQPISSGHAYELSDDARWHIDCFQCNKCNKKLSDESDFLVLSTGALVCYDCSDRCTICKSKIDELAIILSGSDEAYCRNCFKCSRCDDQISNLRYAKTKKGLYCINCHEKLIEKRKQYKLQQQLLNRANSSRQSSTADSRQSSTVDSETYSEFSKISTYEEATDISNKAKTKVKQLPTAPLSELRKKRENSNNEIRNSSNQGFGRPRLNSHDSESFRFKQPPEYNEKSKLASSDSLMNLSTHTTAENSPVVLQQGHFGTRSGENGPREVSLKMRSYSNNESAIKEHKPSNNGLKSAPFIDSKPSPLGPNFENIESTWKFGESSKEVDLSAKTGAPPRSQPLYHARSRSQQKNELEVINSASDSIAKSPTPVANNNVKNTQTQSKKGKTHSRNTSIDDILASTLSRDQSSIDRDLLLNKTPLKNMSSQVPEEGHGYGKIDTSMFHTGEDTAYFMDNKSFLSDENVQLALKMRSEFSPAKEDTGIVDNTTANNSFQDSKKTLVEASKASPSKFGRSLSFKSPKNFFQNMTKSPLSAESHKRTVSVDSAVTDNFSFHPLPNDILTEQQQQKLDTQKRESSANQMYSSNHTQPLSEQTLMDGQQAKMQLNLMLKNAANESKRHPLPSITHQRSSSASSALQRSIHSRQASLDYLNNSNASQKRKAPENENLDFEKKSDDFHFGSLNSSPKPKTMNPGTNNTDVNDVSLQMRNLNLDVYNLENTKRILANEVESLTNQKNKLLLEVNELNSSIKSSESVLRNINSDTGSSGLPDAYHERNVSVASSSLSNNSDKANNMSAAANNHNQNGGRFWKAIFQKGEKTVKPIDKNSIKMTSSVSQPMLNNFIQNGNSQVTLTSEAMSDLVKIENELNYVESNDIDTYSQLTTISNQVVQVRDLSVIGYCKVEGHEGIPYIIRFFVDYLQNNESLMRQEGIYRKAASKTMIERFEKTMYEKYKDFIGDFNKKRQPLDYGAFYKMMSNMIKNDENGMFNDVHLIASCFKRFLRRLIVPVVPFTSYFVIVNDITANVLLPKEHDHTLKLIVSHMNEVSKREADNKMTKYNLAMVFAPSLIRPIDSEREILDFKERVKYIEYLIGS